LALQLKNADIIVAAIGKAHFVKGEWLKPGCVVIDVGTNFIPGSSRLVSLRSFNPSSSNLRKLMPSLPPFSLSLASLPPLSDASKKSGQRLVGDVDFASASKVASFITPVPGGVGPMTVAKLMENTYESAKRHFELGRERHIIPNPLHMLENVPRSVFRFRLSSSESFF